MKHCPECYHLTDKMLSKNFRCPNCGRRKSIFLFDIEKHSSGVVFDEVESLRTQLAECQRERDGWIDLAKHFSNNMEYYRDQLDACARHIGLPCFTADDGGVHPEPLRAKVAEEVGKLQEQLAVMTAERDELKARMNAGGHLTVAWYELAAAQALCQQYREALEEFDGLIRHQYTGTREAMSDLTYAAKRCANVIAIPTPQAALSAAIADWVMSELKDYMYGNGAENLDAFMARRAKELREMK